MPRRLLNKNVFDEAVDRLVQMYEKGHRVIVSFSAGKDSGVCAEICRIAARKTGNLPVEIMMRDEEIMFPGTFEYAERIAKDSDFHFHWIYANQPVVNAFNRNNPYFWVFDPLLKPSQWVRKPPKFAKQIDDKSIEKMVSMERFTPKPGQHICSVIGLRVAESRNRRMAIYSSKGYITKSTDGIIKCRPIYDWEDGDVWKSIFDNNWDYNHAYDVMFRMGLPKQYMRIAPPTLSASSVQSLGMAQAAWPKWFDKVAKRLPGTRTAAQYGRRAVEPVRRYKETWKECFQRTCIDEAPDWITERSKLALEKSLKAHAKHSTMPLPDSQACNQCSNAGSYRNLAKMLYMGDPFSIRFKSLPYVEPEYFRKGAGKWGGTPTF